jgi:hypothetical protein
MSLRYGLVKSLPWIGYAAYPIAVYVAAIHVAGWEASGTHTLATRTLPANHQLESADLSPLDSDKLVGNFLREGIAQGKPITPDMVTPGTMYTSRPNALTAIITIPRRAVVRFNLDAGMTVQICRGSTSIVQRAEVASVACAPDVPDCSVVAVLPKLQDAIDPAFVAGVTVTTPTVGCKP